MTPSPPSEAAILEALACVARGKCDLSIANGQCSHDRQVAAAYRAAIAERDEAREYWPVADKATTLGWKSRAESAEAALAEAKVKILDLDNLATQCGNSRDEARAEVERLKAAMESMRDTMQDQINRRDQKLADLTSLLAAKDEALRAIGRTIMCLHGRPFDDEATERLFQEWKKVEAAPEVKTEGKP